MNHVNRGVPEGLLKTESKMKKEGRKVLFSPLEMGKVCSVQIFRLVFQSAVVYRHRNEFTCKFAAAFMGSM